MAQPTFVPTQLIKTLVCSWIELVFDLLAFLALTLGFIIGLFTSLDRYLGPTDDDIIALVFIGVLMVVFAVWATFKLIVLIQLRRQKRWAWIAALVICGLNFLSFPYLILGIIKLVGLLNNDVMTWSKGQVKSA